MSLNLVKGARADITKDTGVKNIKVALGWDVAQEPGKKFDLDASVFLLGSNGKCASMDDFVYYGMQKTNGKLIHKSGSVEHSGDNLTGAGEGDDEVLTVHLDKVPPTVEKMAFVITIYDAAQRGQNFGMVSHAFARVVNADNNQEMMKYDLTENYSTNVSVLVGEIYRKDGEWKFTAIGTGKAVELGSIAGEYGL